MLVVMKNNAEEKDIAAVVEAIEALGFKARPIPGSNRTAIGTIGNTGQVDDTSIRGLDGIKEIVHITKPYKLASRDFHPADTIVRIADSTFGANDFTIIAGPCSIESEEQINKSAEFLSSKGVKILRGGAFKPRTSPYAFQGLGVEGLKMLAEAGHKNGMRVISEAIDIVSLEDVVEHSDIIQIGARNMQNFPLLKAAGKASKPILLKRGLSATLDEMLLSAEYILNEGNQNIIMCERGVRTFDNHSRNTLDITAVPVLQEKSHLPIIIDPSHATGNRKRVTPVSKAALAVGAHGLIVEVHPEPSKALSDGAQSLTFDQFDELINELKPIAKVTGKKL
ncbi:MAG: 3-deoxy-7-phosphoheptulonate synthase [Calditrichaeota bacterium]|nr:MAG: 3-deoxy-7-phosphoheptulonate synthase [Calditrichota bacterium]MBL1206302.1 3-deoxy-7-phosphoheptulonate synthase [Calditrichota bacterium]NOG46128.1 bifunctional 3-deoxy-7-phosphoheptulonate synthase/chorismate mutase [Calditrichota bacterium]